MTDKELLESAAKAANMGVFVWGSKGSEKFRIKRSDGTPGDMWNPLTDDGDALRLAVKLGMQIWIQDSGCYAAAIPGHDWCNEYGDDPCSATRRAIVRAAAEIGKQKG